MATFARVTDTQFRGWVLQGRSVMWIAHVTGCTVEQVRARKAALWQEARQRSNMTPPTPEEIEQRAAEIRAKWSDAEWYRRAGRSAPVETTVVPVSCLTPRGRGRR